MPGTAPELPRPVLLPELPAPEDAPRGALAPLPEVMPSSFRHFSRSAPIMPRHLLLDELVPEEPAPGEGVALEVPAAPLPVAPVLLLPVAPVALLPDAPDEPVPCASDTPDSAKSAAAVAAVRSFSVIFAMPPYLLVPDPLLDGLLLEPEPMPPELGELGEVVLLLPEAPLLEGLLLDGLLVEPDVPPPALLPLPLSFIAASHSCRETEPSLFLSTDENVGVALLLAPLEELGEAEELLDVPPAELLDVPPAELLGDADDLSVALGLALEPLVPELVCAAATPASARRAAAVAV